MHWPSFAGSRPVPMTPVICMQAMHGQHSKPQKALLVFSQRTPTRPVQINPAQPHTYHIPPGLAQGNESSRVCQLAACAHADHQPQLLCTSNHCVATRCCCASLSTTGLATCQPVWHSYLKHKPPCRHPAPFQPSQQPKGSPCWSC